MTGFDITDAEISGSTARMLLVSVLFHTQNKTMVLTLGFKNISDAKIFLLTNHCVRRLVSIIFDLKRTL
jgi:hypothetical protein